MLGRPFFLRTRRLDIDSLERKPQESMSVVYAILRVGIGDAEDRLRRIERLYYGASKDAATDARKWATPVKSVMNDTHLSRLTLVWHIEKIIQLSDHLRSNFDVDRYNINKLRELTKKVQHFVPDAFSEITDDLRRIVKYLDKYCVSFYSMESEIVFGTAEHYEKERRQFRATIKKSIANIAALPHKFQTTGLSDTDLSSYGEELCRKADCADASFIVMFAEVCENVRAACSAVRSWIDTDVCYSEFVGNDIKQMETDIESALVPLRKLEDQFYHTHYRLKQAGQEISRVEEELDGLHERENEFIFDEEQLVRETNDIGIQIEMKEYRRDELVRNATDYHPKVLQQKYAELCEELRELKTKLPLAKRRLLNARRRLEWLGEKKEQLRVGRQTEERLQDELEEIKILRESSTHKHENTKKMLEVAKEIYLYKTSPDSIEKIYNEQPVEMNSCRLPGYRHKGDPFERACVVVAGRLGSDWVRLYRHLPFHPSRGNATIDADIQLLTDVPRTSLENVVARSIDKWRIYHTRAKIEDLRETLNVIGRRDVLQAIDNELNPKQSSESTDEQPRSVVDSYLLPYLKLVERFDQLRAANKI